MQKTKFAMAFHCYQPVFNFDSEIEHAYKMSYLPLLRTLEKFPEVKASFHYSGNILEWLEENHPGYISLVGKLLARQQIELIGGGCFEPLMTLIPEEDRKGQIRLNDDILKKLFNIETKGAWIAERVWDSSLIDTLVKAGKKYTIVDDNHILSAGLKKEKLFKPCSTGEGDNEIVLFPTLSRLRYTMPFRSPEDTLDYMMRKRAKNNSKSPQCFFFADDGEKFGAWPHTYKWVYTKGWLEKFFGLLQKNSSWLETATYSEILENVSPEKIGKIPGASYSEMMDWCDGDFNNFLKKYPEVSRMHRRMLYVSEDISKLNLERLPKEKQKALQEAKQELFKSQASCAYWHGTFGGVYLPHLRDGVYKHLIRAQNMVDRVRGKQDTCIRALEHDLGKGRRETTIGNRTIDVFVESAKGGKITEIDYKPSDTNLMNTMSRQEEKYHKKLKSGYFLKIKAARQAMMRGEAANIHDILGVKERGLRNLLFYDDYQRESFLTHIFKDLKAIKHVRNKHYMSASSFLQGSYNMKTETDGTSIFAELSKRDKIFAGKNNSYDIEVVKNIVLGKDSEVLLSHKIINHSEINTPFRYGIELNFMIWDKNIMKRDKVLHTDKFYLKDRYKNIEMKFELSRKLTVFEYPVYTVNETEEGLSKLFQGISVMMLDEAGSGPSGTCDVDIKMSIGRG